MCSMLLFLICLYCNTHQQKKLAIDTSSMKPRCALEALAQTIFRAHVDTLSGCEEEAADGAKEGEEEKKLLYDPERSGAEWWTLVLDTPSGGARKKEDSKKSADDNGSECEEEDDEVGMHFDADYGMYPHISVLHFSTSFIQGN